MVGVASAITTVDLANAADVRGYIGFQGEWHNPDGTIHLRARSYHPRLRRFLQRDVYAGRFAATPSLNRYAFAENNPATWSDPSGYNTLKKLRQALRCAAGLLGAPGLPCSDIGFNSEVDNVTTKIAPPVQWRGFGTSSRSADCSFDADTAVATPEGERPIASIRPGDEVYGKDPRTGVVAAFRVLETMATPDEEVIAVSVGSATGESETILTTPNHPFHVVGRGFVEAGALRAGEDVVTTRSGAVIVEALRSVTRATMYNLDVDGFDTFLVGASQLLVHNHCARSAGSGGANQGGAVLDRSWTKNNKLDKPKLRELSRRLNELGAGIDITVDIDPRPVITQGPNCSIYGNCDGIAARARAILSRYPANEVLSREVAPQMPFTFADSSPPVVYQGTAAQFAQHAKPGTLGIIGTDNFKHAGGDFAGHAALILQTTQGPVVLDMQRGGQIYDVSTFPNALVSW
jgi:RHS repeat-associated protein